MTALDQARLGAQQAAGRSGVAVRILESSAYDDARGVFDTVWPDAGGSSQLLPNVIKAAQHSGGYLSGAYDLATGEACGAAFGLIGRHREPDGSWTPYLHSHMAAVLEGYRDRSVGTALKLHQRWWALEQELPVVTWTFDPLVRRNAWFNLVKLGCRIAEFHADFYGDMNDAINAGDLTDRCLAWWEVGSQRAVDAAAGTLVVRSGAQWVQAGAQPLLEEVDGRPAVRAVEASAPALTVVLPEDIVAVRVRDARLARSWREALREALQAGIGAGYAIDTVTAEGAYVLTRP